MKLNLLGEGSSDLGEKCALPDEGFCKGPMTLVIDAVVAGAGVTDVEYHLYSRGDVSVGIKASKRRISPRPKSVDKEKQWFYQAAWWLGGQTLAGKQNGAVFFHDPDHSRAESSHTAVEIENAMLTGFGMAQCETGVPMVPNPRSEAWLLAYFQKGLPGQQSYNKSERFEDLPATDKSPNSVKKLLQKALCCESELEVYPKVMDEFSSIDWSRVSMPSFNRFKGRLLGVLATDAQGKTCSIKYKA